MIQTAEQALPVLQELFRRSLDAVPTLETTELRQALNRQSELKEIVIKFSVLDSDQIALLMIDWIEFPAKGDAETSKLTLILPKSNDFVRSLAYLIPQLKILVGEQLLPGTEWITADYIGSVVCELPSLAFIDQDRLSSIWGRIHVPADDACYFGIILSKGRWKTYAEGYGRLKESIKRPEGFLYIGNFTNRKRQGQGRCWQNNKVYYEGEYIQGLKDGYGKEVTSKKRQSDFKEVVYSQYTGEFREDLRCGQGVEITSTQKYQGQWKSGQKCGYGVLTSLNSPYRYEGEWLDGLMHGSGTIYQNDGSMYKGQFEMGKKNRQGVMEYSNGDNYEGQWLSDKRHGTGRFVWSDDDYYDGKWEYDKKHGKGVQVIEGQISGGQFEDDALHGIGWEQNQEGDTVYGVYEDGERITLLDDYEPEQDDS